jgi:hypothetical protein
MHRDAPTTALLGDGVADRKAIGESLSFNSTNTVPI